eukprot:6934613-Alexandrium_andersonii.AAC.1
MFDANTPPSLEMFGPRHARFGIRVAFAHQRIRKCAVGPTDASGGRETCVLRARPKGGKATPASGSSTRARLDPAPLLRPTHRGHGIASAAGRGLDQNPAHRALPPRRLVGELHSKTLQGNPRNTH